MKENIEFVDLGLPRGTLWATKNVGAQEVYSCAELMRKPLCEEHLPTYEQCKELIEQYLQSNSCFNYNKLKFYNSSLHSK